MLDEPRRSRDHVAVILSSLAERKPVAFGQPPLVLMVGLPASGKSSFSRRLAPLIDAVVLESDRLRALLFDQPTHLPAESHQLFSAMSTVAGLLLSERVGVILDATNLTEAERQPAYAIADHHELQLIIVSCYAPPEEIARRLEARGAGLDPDDHSDADIEVYRRMARRSQQISRERWLLDTSQEAETAEVLNLITEISKVTAAGSAGGRY